MCWKTVQLACDIMRSKFKGGCTGQSQVFYKTVPNSVRSINQRKNPGASIRERIQEQTSIHFPKFKEKYYFIPKSIHFPKFLLLCCFQFFKDHIQIAFYAFTELTIARRRYFNPKRNLFYYDKPSGAHLEHC